MRVLLVLALGFGLQASAEARSLTLEAGNPKPKAQDEPATRAVLLRREREEKSRQLTPADPSRVERLLLDLENGRLFERLLNPAEGFYPRIGNISAGSGISFGPAYRRPGLFGGHADFSSFAAASFQGYWMADARMRMPRLAGETASIDIHAQRYEFPDENFFGLGPESRREDHVTFGLRNSIVGGTGAVHPTRWLAIGGGFDYLAPRISTTGDGRRIGVRFGDADAPGLGSRRDFVRFEAFADLNYREPRGNPRRGGRYALALQRFDDTADNRYSFSRVEADLQQYISLLRDRRVLALHAFVSTSDVDAGHEIPFYLQRTLGGPDDLRGFRRFRFRDRHMLLLQAEYRWEIFTAVDGAIFYDAGRVASRVEDLNPNGLESDYGIGFRFGTRNGVFLRVEGAFGSAGGKHFIFRFGHVF
ncbi:MAG: BamA/TamA family outer membrane protein [Acidobacteria bacterium]|nr:BamA/TamA family outer membrane protein [Acidobacteriota bacterium]